MAVNGKVQPRYPLFAISVDDLLQLETLLPHQELLRMGKLRRYEPGMVVLFVSHQWVARKHPDPAMAQFKVLQGCLRRLATGSASVGTHWISTFFFDRDVQLSKEQCGALQSAYVWYDYFSIPQAALDPSLTKDFLDAVSSIPEYICFSTHFFVLCPPLVHECGRACDFSTWSKRGWCMVEETSWRLGHFNEPVVLVQGEQQATLHDSQDYFHHPIGRGEFTCCELGHRSKDGREIPCDKDQISPVVQRLLRELLESKVTSGSDLDVFYFRLLKSLSHVMLEGLPRVPVEDRGRSVETFRKEWCFDGFAAPQEQRQCSLFGGCSSAPAAVGGWSSIFFAVLAEDYGLVRELVRRGEPVDVRSTSRLPGLLLGTGSTPLMAASFLLHSGEAVRLLLDLRADCNAKTVQHQSPLHWSALGGHPRNVEELLRAGADRDLPDWRSRGPIFYAVSLRRPDAAEVLLEAKVDLRGRHPFGVVPVMGPAQCGDVEILRQLLDHTGEEYLNWQSFPQSWKHHLMAFVAMSKFRAGATKPVDHFLAQQIGATPLMLAAETGSHGCVEELLRRGARTDIRNSLGYTALDLARLYGHHSAAQLLEQGASDLVVDI